MKRLLILITIILLISSGCTQNSTPDLMDEDIQTFEVTEVTSPPTEDDSSSTSEDSNATTEPQSTQSQSLSLEEKFATIDFYMVSGFYSRNVAQDDLEFMEMFALEKSNFIRIAENELEQEVFAYNYVSDDFTYIYYFDGEMMNKTVFNVSTGAVLEDPDGFAEHLQANAEELKTYFSSLLNSSDIIVDELQN